MDEPTTYSRRLIFNSLFNVSATIGKALIAFFLVPFLVRYLGKDAYGVWTLVGSIFAYSMTLGFGLSSAINRYVPVYLVEKDKKGIDSVIGTSVAYCVFVGLVILGVAVAAYFNLDKWFAIPPDLVRASKVLVLIVGGAFALSMPLRPFGAVISGLQRYDIHSLGSFIPIAVRAVFVVVLLAAGYGLVTVGVVYGLCEVLIVSVYLVFSRKLLGSLSVSFRSFSMTLLRDMLAYGVNTFLYITAAIIVYKGSDIIIGVFLTTRDVTMFAIAVAPLFMVSQLLETSVAVLKPAVSDLDARNDQERVREISFLSQKYSLLLLFPAISFLILMGREFLVLWVGSDFGELGLVLTVLAAGRFVMLAQYSNFLVLVGKGEHKVFGVMAVSMALTAMALGILFVGKLDMGIMGMATACAIPMVVIYGAIMPVYYNRRMDISTRECVRWVFRPAIFGSTFAVALIAVWKFFAPPGSWLHLGAVIVSVVAVWSVSVWKLSLSPVEKTRLLKILLPRRFG
jgi:O-antigen/teichoic acid export membrane protein